MKYKKRYPKSKYKLLNRTYPVVNIQMNVKYIPIECIGFKINTMQTDNGREFCNDKDNKKSMFEKELEKQNIKYIRTRPYSPQQNGVVERSHKTDNEQFYSRKRFKSEE